MSTIQRYDDEAFALYDELFSYACPKFITPSAPTYDEPLVNYNPVCGASDKDEVPPRFIKLARDAYMPILWEHLTVCANLIFH